MCTSVGSASSVSATVPDVGREGPAADRRLVEELVTANRILFQQGVLDAFGHVSARHDKRADRFLLARNLAPALVTEADILEFDLGGDPVSAHGRAVYLERFIHGELYRARPDVMAVVHSHSPAVVPFGIVRDVPLRPVCHLCGFLGESAPVFEIRDVAGEASDLLIRDRRLGAALAGSLGSAAVVLMRGHGSTAVGTSLREVVYRAVYTEVNARLQADALRLGAVNYLTAGEAATAAASAETQVDRAWDLWRMGAEGKLPGSAPRAGGRSKESPA
jgi:ribulose-5-phosphate 4-epimerase/fuculose-1-phosphate aldolase